MKYLRVTLLIGILTLLFGSTPLHAENLFLDYLNGTRIYFSHIAVSEGWETEIAVINPTANDADITLTPYNELGGAIGGPVQFTLPAHGRYLRLVGQSFSNPAAIAYILLESPVFGLKGYSKFYYGSGATAIRASIIASAPRKSGIFAKIDHTQNAWTGIVFINTSPDSATITLTAYDDRGGLVAETEKTVRPGEKAVDVAEDLFSRSIDRAAYVEFTSNRDVVGFYLNGNGSMLDGSQAQ